MDFAPLIRAAQASLRAGLQERIDDWNDDTANTAELTEVPDEDIHFGPMAGWLAHRKPAIEIAIPEVTIDNFAIAQLAGDAKGPVIVAAWVEGPAGESDRIYETALGYSKCILDVMLQPDAWGPGVVIERVECMYPGFNPRPEEREPTGIGAVALHVFAFDDESARSQ